MSKFSLNKLVRAIHTATQQGKSYQAVLAVAAKKLGYASYEAYQAANANAKEQDVPETLADLLPRCNAGLLLTALWNTQNVQLRVKDNDGDRIIPNEEIWLLEDDSADFSPNCALFWVLFGGVKHLCCDKLAETLEECWQNGHQYDGGPFGSSELNLFEVSECLTFYPETGSFCIEREESFNWTGTFSFPSTFSTKMKENPALITTKNVATLSQAATKFEALVKSGLELKGERRFSEWLDSGEGCTAAEAMLDALSDKEMAALQWFSDYLGWQEKQTKEHLYHQFEMAVLEVESCL